MEGLTYTKSFEKLKDVDYACCLELLIEQGAQVSPDPKKRKRERSKRPYPIFQARRNERMLKVFIDAIRKR